MRSGKIKVTLTGATVVAMVLVPALAGCGTSTTTLLPNLRGARTATGKLIIDEAHGRIGPLYLGMSMAAARRALPTKNYWTQGSDPSAGHLRYCSSINGGACAGDVELDVTSACAVMARVLVACPTGNDDSFGPGPLGPVGEIDLYANDGENQFVNPETWEAVTLRGIHLGSTIAQVKRKYRITARAQNVDCAFGGAGGPTLTAVAGQNTIVFTRLNGLVYEITLFAGRQPRACSH